jgi:hypothetical protein
MAPFGQAGKLVLLQHSSGDTTTVGPSSRTAGNWYTGGLPGSGRRRDQDVASRP